MTIGTQTIASINFTGTNGTTPPAAGMTVLDSNPTPAQIQSNACQFTGNYSANPNLLRLMPKASMGAAPVRVQLDMSQIVIYQGVFYLASGTIGSNASGYFVYFDGGTVVIDRYVSGVATNILTSYWGVTYYGGSSVRFDYDDSSGSPVFTVTYSGDSYASSKTVTDTNAAKMTGVMDLIYYTSDGSGVTSTIDNVIVTGTSSSTGAAIAASSVASNSSAVRLGTPGLRLTLRDMDTNVLKNAVTYANVHVFLSSSRGSVFASFTNVTTSAAGVMTLTNPNVQYGTSYDVVGWTSDGSDRFHATGTGIDTSV